MFDLCGVLCYNFLALIGCTIPWIICREGADRQFGGNDNDKDDSDWTGIDDFNVDDRARISSSTIYIYFS